MRVVVASVGSMKDGAERTLLEKYQARFEAAGRRLGLSPIVWREVALSRAADVAKRKAEETAGLLKLARDTQSTVVLDQRGKLLTSKAFADYLARIRDGGAKSAAILIGGPDGVAPAAFEAAQLTFSLGAITLPHGLARIILAEQLYRAATILAAHPYHRA
jgi:23S rRNA (pseudouridine1915-N3)-methyltransferase